MAYSVNKSSLPNNRFPINQLLNISNPSREIIELNAIGVHNVHVSAQDVYDFALVLLILLIMNCRLRQLRHQKTDIFQ